ncbi:hypothetical protein CBF34_10605 [Vagococcus penaei]|uniref:Uncharacterized protein n=1 Tax=Vagococcus penaei TaxID=633807 RepID=A0A1Q2D3E9_9ENTE|nr:hypothetical protein [Vagococcus penaei]AQP52855.1 hypothetical protein BW732_00535 [Vagococcus penaei]RST98176.1 hypothetical protein CBF34_10605 [Vagococcus penaei]
MSHVTQQSNIKKKKKQKVFVFLFLFIMIMIAVVLLIKSVIRPKIREQQIISVVNLKSQHQKVQTIKENQLQKILHEKDDFVLVIIDGRGNTADKELMNFLNNSNNLKEIKTPIYIYQPIYNINQINQEYQLTAKNNLLFMENGKEIQRLAFDSFGNTQEKKAELQKQLFTLVNPVIPERKPIRVKQEKQLDFSVNQGEEVPTEEITFNE